MTTAADAKSLPHRISPRTWFALILAAGLVLQFALAFVIFPGQGFAADLGSFEQWAATLARVGPGGFYAVSGANYPPGYMYVLWLVGELGTVLGPILGISNADAILLLVRIPPILADGAIAFLLYRAGGSWFGGRAGLVAAALYLFVPVSWYDSALWGQVDAIGALLMLAALLALADGWSEPAMSLAVLAVLVKPQDAICLVVVLPVLFRRHLLRVGSGPVPSLGRRLSALDDRLGGRLTDQGPLRFGVALLVGSIVAIVPLLPFDIARYAPSSLADLPVIGQVSGLIGLFQSVSGQYAVLTANAFNAWSLVGSQPLTTIAGGGGSWTADSLVVFLGLTAFELGALMLASVCLVVAGGLLLRDDRRTVVLAFAVVAFAFYAVPTRVHERYLFPFFPAAALLAAPYVARAIAYCGLALLNAVNLHAVLGSPNTFGGFGGGGAGFGPGGGGGYGSGGFGSGGFGFGGGAGGSVVSAISLPFADLMRSEALVAAVAVGQTLGFGALLVTWIGVAFGPVIRPFVKRRHGGAQPLPAGAVSGETVGSWSGPEPWDALLPTQVTPAIWWAVQDSNLRHPRCKRGALTAELTAPGYQRRTLVQSRLGWRA